MDIQINREICTALAEYNKGLEKNYGNVVLDAPPVNKKYPLTVIQNIRDVANANYNSCYGRVSSKGYKVHIYAQDKGKISRVVIAETIAKNVDDFLGRQVGLIRESYNSIDLENEGTTLHIIMTYSGNLDEYRRKFI